MKKLLSLILFAGMCHIASAGDVDIEALKADYARPSDIPFPEENPYTDAKANLGKNLFFDPRLSRSGVMSCATCHNPSFSWGEWQPTGVGEKHQILGRKDPTVLNLAWDDLYFWDGRAETLEEQALGPIEAGGEMNLPLEDAVLRLKGIKQYVAMFKEAFPNDQDPVNAENIGKSIATYERTIVSGEAPFDQWLNGDEEAISESAKRGFVLFNKKANCAACHSGWNFSDSSFHDIGIDSDDVGRGKFVPLKSMQFAFKTVGLRNIDRRGPYMHNGSLKTLRDVVNHYDHGFVKRDSLSEEVFELKLTEQEKTDLVAFLRTLTSEDPAVTLPNLPQ